MCIWVQDDHTSKLCRLLIHQLLGGQQMGGGRFSVGAGRRLDLLAPDLDDQRLQGEVLQELLSDWVDGEVLAEVKVWVGGVGDGAGFGRLVVEIELILAVHSLCDAHTKIILDEYVFLCMREISSILPW